MRRIGILLLVAGVVAVALAYGVFLVRPEVAVAPWLLGLGSTGVLAGLACLGAARRGRKGRRIGLAIGVAFTAVGAGLLLALTLPAPVAEGPLLLGLPRVTTVLLLLTGLVPLLLLPVAFALAFDDEVISEQDLTRLRAAAESDA